MLNPLKTSQYLFSYVDGETYDAAKKAGEAIGNAQEAPAAVEAASVRPLSSVVSGTVQPVATI